jgi:hypothetical protein
VQFAVVGAALAFGLMAASAPAAVGAPAQPSGRISGLVTGHGHPLNGICVYATLAHDTSFFHTHTSKTGHYTIGSITPGRYYVTFAGCLPSVGNWLHQWYKGVTAPSGDLLKPPHGAVAVRVTASKTVTGIDASLKEGASISGTVTSASSGAQLNRSCVSATSGNQATFAIQFTPRDGRYSLNALFPGSYLVEFGCGWNGTYNYAPQWWRSSATEAQATPIRVTDGQQVRNVNGKLGVGAVITGTVKATNSAGAPLAEVCVSATSSVPGADSGGTSTGADGSYQLAGLATAKYTVTFDPDCGGVDAYQGQKVTAQATTGSTTSGVNAYLQPSQ